MSLAATCLLALSTGASPVPLIVRPRVNAPGIHLASSAPTPAAGRPETEDVPAQPFEGVLWLDAPESDPTLTEVDLAVMGMVQATKGVRLPSLESWHGHPVVVLLRPDSAPGADLEFVRLLARANLDRGLVAATLVPAPEGDLAPDGGSDAPPPLDRAELRERLGIAEGEALPRPAEELFVGYVEPGTAWSPSPGPYAVVLGPSGERLGEARLPEEEDRLVELLGSALNRHPAPALAADLPEELREAQALYFRGDWAKARRVAAKVAKSKKKKAPELAVLASEFSRKIDAYERELQIQLVDAMSGVAKHEVAARIVLAARRGFPKGVLMDTAKSMEAAEKKTMTGGMGYAAARAYVEGLPERPVLFPEVSSSKGAKYNRKLCSLLSKSSSFEGVLTRQARSLVSRYGGAKKRR